MRCRCGAQVVGSYGSMREALPLPATQLVLWDVTDVQPSEIQGTQDRLASEGPQTRLVPVDGRANAETVVAAVRQVLNSGRAPHESLTPQENEVLLAVAVGLRNADIARRMRRSSKTIEKHRANLQRKLGLRTAAQLTAYAIHHGLLTTAGILGARQP